MNRRDFLRSASTAIVVCGSSFAVRILAAEKSAGTFYYVDGYHGGARGHMPVGCWRDILESMRAFPDWKLSLDVEAASWDVLQREDPESYSELKAMIEADEAAPRVEIVGGTFAQPYGWAVSGESNIRQLQRGLEMLHRHFPKARVQTYAVQEPCWASCMPQLLRSFGFSGASLKNASTAWGGYTQGFDAELVNWIGPDGSSVLAVPRYACEDLRAVYETEANLCLPSFVQKCFDHRIPEPVGMCFQDLGWTAKPRIHANNLRFVTWSEYLHRVAKVPARDWHFSMEDILTTLPWGEKTLHKVTQQVRVAETRLVQAEKMAAMACLQASFEWPRQQLEEAWEQTLWSQAHDAWITATTRSGRQAWAFQVAAETMDAEEKADSILEEAASSLCASHSGDARNSNTSQCVQVFNTHAADHAMLVEVELATHRGTRSLQVLNQEGAEVICQLVPTRSYLPLAAVASLSEHGDVGRIGSGGTEAKNDGVNAGKLLFQANVPAYGYATYRIAEKDAEPKAARGVMASLDADGNALLESDLYRIRLDANRGGAITSLYSKALGKEFSAEKSQRLLHEFYGYFIAQKRWCSSTDSVAKIDLIETGPLRVCAKVSGVVGGNPFQSILVLVQGQERIDFQTTFQFHEDTWIGDPWDIRPEARSTERRRSQNSGRWKLQAHFPVSLDECSVYKSSAFDVCKSRNIDTDFERWDEIKHNIVTNWVDIYDARQNKGLALFSDRTTNYTFGPNDPLALAIGWGWEGGFWWGKCPLLGEQQASYSILPHAGKWTTANLWAQNAVLEEPLIARMIDRMPRNDKKSNSFLCATPESVQLSAAQVREGKLEIRLFNACEEGVDCRIETGFAMAHVERIELDGRPVEPLTFKKFGDTKSEIHIQIPRFGIRTLRINLGAVKG